jgi:hypothetical protein
MYVENKKERVQTVPSLSYMPNIHVAVGKGKQKEKGRTNWIIGLPLAPSSPLSLFLPPFIILSHTPLSLAHSLPHPSLSLSLHFILRTQYTHKHKYTFSLSLSLSLFFPSFPFFPPSPLGTLFTPSSSRHFKHGRLFLCRPEQYCIIAL